MRNNPAIVARIVLSVQLAASFVSATETLLVIEPTETQPRNSEGDILELTDGRLCLIYTRFRGGGSDHDSADLAMRISSDEGRTWSDDEVVVGMADGLNVMSVSLLRLQNGAIALFYLKKTSLEDCRPVMQVSRDEGKSWTEPMICITDQIGYYVLNNDRAVQLASGRLVLPVALHRRLGDPEPDWDGQVMCYLSDDQGQTWRRSKDVRQGTSPQGQRVTTQEPGVVELKDGRLMMYVAPEAVASTSPIPVTAATPGRSFSPPIWLHRVALLRSSGCPTAVNWSVCGTITRAPTPSRLARERRSALQQAATKAGHGLHRASWRDLPTAGIATSPSLTSRTGFFYPIVRVTTKSVD